MDIKHLKTLVAVADYRTFGAAADARGMTQSAVSQQIRSMEDQFQVQLFDRTTRPPTLSPSGAKLVTNSREIIRLYDLALRELTGESLSGTLQIGAMRTTLTGVLPEALAILHEKYPDLNIKVTTGNAVDLAAHVRSGQMDAAIIPSETPEIGDLHWHQVSREPLMIIAQKSLAGQDGRSLLESQPYIRFSRSVPIAAIIERKLNAYGIRYSADMQIDSFAAIQLAVSHGLGVSIVPKQAIENPFPDNVISMPFGDPPLTRDIGIVINSGSQKGKLTKALEVEMRRLCQLFGQ
ncbi:MAG: LysR family transcriptional regulator [Marinosulfonomonas sp.]|nr:LysR family transcriptional regulator [Marinosulfonomonas sp.]